MYCEFRAFNYLARAYSRAIKAGRLVDVRAGRIVENQGILVEGERIKAVGPLAQIQKATPSTARVIDLSRATVLPGLADCHTHILLQGDITAADYDEQLLKESIPYRTIRATVAARIGLLNGFTVMRDLETEGAMYADVDVKTAINRGVIPGLECLYPRARSQRQGCIRCWAIPGN